MKGAASWIALALSFVGALVAAGAYYRVRSGASGSADAAAVEALKARITRLEGEVARLSREWSGERPPGPPGLPRIPDSDLTDLRRRVEALEHRPVGTPPGFTDQGHPARGNATAIEMHKKRLLDTSKTDHERATALASLRLLNAHKTDDVVDAALALLTTAQEPRERALVLRGLKNAENPKMVPALIRTLASDSDEDVRVEAAETLADYKSQADAKAALEQALNGDASSKVRVRAEKVLGVAPKK